MASCHKWGAIRQCRSAGTDESTVQVFRRLSQFWKPSNQWLHVIYFLVKKPNFGFVPAGSTWSNLAATVGGPKLSWGQNNPINLKKDQPSLRFSWPSLSSVGARKNIPWATKQPVPLYYPPNSTHRSRRKRWIRSNSDNERWNSGYNPEGGKMRCDGGVVKSKRRMKKTGNGYRAALQHVKCGVV